MLSRASSSVDAARCDELIARRLAGDESALRDLTAVLWPYWHHLVSRSRAMAALERSDDAVRDVLVILVEKLQADDARALRQYVAWKEANAPKGFEDWMRIVAANAVRSYVRARLGAAGVSRSDQVPSASRLLREFFAGVAMEQLAERPTITPVQTARQVVEFAEGRLDAAQLCALKLWLEGTDFGEIAAGMALGGGAAEATRVVRSALAILRRKFAGS